MKKYIVILSIFIVILIAFSNIVFAEETHDNTNIFNYSCTANIPDEYDRALPSAGITPDSWLYGLKRLSETIDIFFTFNEQEKAEKYVRYAETRLSEVKEMSASGKDEVIQDLLNDYITDMESSNSIIESEKNKGMNVSYLTEFIAVATTIHIDFMQDMLNMAESKDVPVIRRTINYSYDNGENILEILEEIHPLKAAEINAIIAEKYLLKAIDKAQKNDSDEIVELLIEYNEKINKSQNIIDSLEYYLGENISSVLQLIDKVVSTHDEVISDLYSTISNDEKSRIMQLINSTLNIDKDFIDEVEGIVLSEDLSIKEKINKVYEAYIQS